jgi:hypothetical protein
VVSSRFPFSVYQHDTRGQTSVFLHNKDHWSLVQVPNLLTSEHLPECEGQHESSGVSDSSLNLGSVLSESRPSHFRKFRFCKRPVTTRFSRRTLHHAFNFTLSSTSHAIRFLCRPTCRNWCNAMASAIRELTFSLRCCWRCNSSGMLHCVVGELVSDFSKDRYTLVFRIKLLTWVYSFLSCLTLKT